MIIDGQVGHPHLGDRVFVPRAGRGTSVERRCKEWAMRIAPLFTGHDGGVQDVPINDDMIRLGQFLKLANLIDSGSDARILLEDGSVRVNGQSERRRGRQLHRGDVVTVQDHQVRVA